MPEEIIFFIIPLIFPIFFVVIFATVFKAIKSSKEQARIESEKRKKEVEEANAMARARREQEERRRKASEMRSIARTFGVDEDDKAKKHAAHVADSHAHGHTGDEEHYEEIVGSLGEVNDEGCADLNGVRFIANDLAYEINTQESVDYDRLAQAMVLGEIVNSPRFKMPYGKK